MNEFTWVCPLCESTTEHHHFFARVIGKLWNTGYVPVPVLYAVCDKCGMVFQWYHMDDKELYQYYASQYRATVQGGDDGVTDRVIREQTLRVQTLLPELPFESVKKHLDIGASTGVFMQAMTEKYGCESLGIEPGEKFRIYAKKNNIKMLSDLDILHHEHEKQFDLITIIHVLEHLPDPSRMLIRLHDYIAPDGRLLIEVPSLYHEFSLNLSHPLAFTPETLTALLNANGWHIEWLKEYSGFKERPNPPNILVCCKPGEIIGNSLYVDIDEIKTKYDIGQKVLYELSRNAAGKAD